MFLTVAGGWTLGGVEATPKIWDIAAVWAIPPCRWRRLGASGLTPAPFPWKAGKDYSAKPYPTLATARQGLVDIVLGLWCRLWWRSGLNLQ